MKNLIRLAFLMILATSFALTSCDPEDDDDDVVVNENFKNLKAKLIADSLDIPKVMNAWVTTAEAVYNANFDTIATNDFYIIDLRSAADYAAGHIEGAVNSTLPNILTTAQGHGTKPIMVVCYTGQTAAVGNMALRLSGYPTSKIMKWGMSGWNASLDKITANVSSQAVGHANWEPAPGNPATLVDFGDPVIVSTAADATALLAERVTKVLADGLTGVTGTEAITTPTDYFINNYWTAADVTTYGHIKGAYRINPLTLSGGEYKNLSTAKTVVTYCWTGQTSAMITTYLRVIGYDAKTLKFGTNSLIHSQLTSNKWDVTTQAKNYPLVTK